VRRGRREPGAWFVSLAGFNPLPRRATRETQPRGRDHDVCLVSIHSRVVRRGRQQDGILQASYPGFQSTPASCDAGDSQAFDIAPKVNGFNPLPRRATRETTQHRPATGQAIVSIHSRVVRRGRQHGIAGAAGVGDVSIHSRVVRRGRQGRKTQTRRALAFQSTPASCDAGDLQCGFVILDCFCVSIHSRVVRRGRRSRWRARCVCWCFNPLPRRATRETGCWRGSWPVGAVSIHSRVVRRGRPGLAWEGERGVEVSIHSRVVRRGRRAFVSYNNPQNRFNPLPRRATRETAP